MKDNDDIILFEYPLLQHLYILLFEKCDSRVLSLDSNVLSLRWLI